MKYFSLIFFSLWLTFSSAQELNDDQKAISNLIQLAYAEGLQNEGDMEKIDRGFHPDFSMISKGTEEKLDLLSLERWKEYKTESLASGKLPRKAADRVSLSFDFIDVSGDVAVAKVKYFEGETQTYLDYISLYRYEEGWKIISKIYHKL
jgi:hypothetical protein